VTIPAVSRNLAEVGIQTGPPDVYTKVNVILLNQTARDRLRGANVRNQSSQPSLAMFALKAGTVAAVAAALLAGRVPEAAIVLGVIVGVSIVSWHRIQPLPAPVRSQHRFTVVSRSGDEFVTVDSSGIRRVVRTAPLDGTIS
jgi:hypothetical protein